MDPTLATARARATRDLEQLRAAAAQYLAWTRWPRRHPWLVLAGAAAAGWTLNRALRGRRRVVRTRRAAGVAARTFGSALAGLALRWAAAALEGYLRRSLTGGSLPGEGALRGADRHATMPPAPGG